MKVHFGKYWKAWCIPFFVVLLFVSGFRLHAQPELKTGYADSTLINKQLLRARNLLLAGVADSAQELYRELLRQSQHTGYGYGVVKSMIGLGNVAINRAEYNRAIQLYNAALDTCARDRIVPLYVTIYNNIASVYNLQGKFEQSMEYYQKAINHAEKFASELPVETLYSNIAGVMARLHQPDNALYYLEKGERLARENENYYTLSDICHNKGMALSFQKKYAESDVNFKQAVELARKHGYINVRHSALVNLAINSLNRDMPEQALPYLREAEGIQGAVNPYYVYQRHLAMGKALMLFERYSEAEMPLQRALAMAEQMDNHSNIAAVRMVMADLYANMGSYETAFRHLYTAKQLNDSLNIRETADNIAAVEVKYRTAQKDKDLAQQQLTIDRQSRVIYKRNLGIGLSLGGLLLLVIMLLLLRNVYRNRQKLKDAEMHSLKRDKELNEINAKLTGEEMERTRIARDLHDDIMVRFAAVKMNLSALMGTARPSVAKDELKPVVQQLDKATAELRRTAHNLMPDMLLQEGLAEAVYYFCNSLQPNVSFKIVFHQLGELPRLDVRLELAVYRIIQELLQNIIKHAAAQEAIVQLSYNMGLLSITVEDNGKGMRTANDVETDGLGLKSIKARVEELKGNIDIESHPGEGTSVRIEFEHSPKL
jgi:signal transduction histidine kinase/Tfp pilus assembly protein PilF